MTTEESVARRGRSGSGGPAEKQFGLPAHLEILQLTCPEFLDALYIPERSRDAAPLEPVLRCESGNRANALAIASESVGAKVRRSRRAGLQQIRQIIDEQWTVFVRSLVAVSVLLVVLFLTGLGVQGAYRSPGEDTRRSPEVFSMASTASADPGTSAPRSSVAAEEATVVRDDAGRVVEIRSSDPASVLVGFCGTMPISDCYPVELAWSDPPHPNLRFGLYRDGVSARAIQIRRDPVTRRWFAGDGRDAIESFLADSLRLSDRRLGLGNAS